MHRVGRRTIGMGGALAAAFLAASAAWSEMDVSLRFDGVHTFVQVPHHPDLSLAQGGTMEAWVYIEDTGNSLRPCIVSKSATEDPTSGWEWSLTNGVIPELRVGGGYVKRGGLALGRWAHLAVAFNTNSWRIYIDGQWMADAIGGPFGTENVDVYIGDHAGTADRKFRGRLREIRIWDHLRTGAELKASMMTPLEGDEPGLVAYWPLDEGAGTIAHDQSGNGHDGIITSGLWSLDDGLPDGWAPVRVESDPPASTREMRLLEFTAFGAQRRGAQCIEARGQQLVTIGGQEMDAGQGQTLSAEYFRRTVGDAAGWERVEIYPVGDRKTSMFEQLGPETEEDQPVFFTYTRRDVGGAHLHRVEPDGTHRELFSYGVTVTNEVPDEDVGVDFLNPAGTLSSSGTVVNLFVPDRNGGGRMRWFQVDADTGDLLWRMPDRMDFPSGTRIYDRVIDANGRVHVPVGTSAKTYMWWVDPETRQNGPLTEIDDTTGLGQANETSRMFSIDLYPQKGTNGILLVTYMRPATFSQRKAKGLVGNAVALSLDASTYEVLSMVTVGGAVEDEAATHYLQGCKVDDNHFAMAYTTVSNRHVFHQTLYHDNYVEGRLDVWRLHDNGTMSPVHTHVVAPSWHPNVTTTLDGTLHKVYSEAERNGRDALLYERWRVLTNPAIRVLPDGTEMNGGWHMVVHLAGVGGPGIGHDQWTTTGDLTLDGTFEIVLDESYTPGAGDAFQVLAAGGSLSGGFHTIDLLYGTLPSGLAWDTDSLATTGWLYVVTEPPEGDGP